MCVCVMRLSNNHRTTIHTFVLLCFCLFSLFVFMYFLTFGKPGLQGGAARVRGDGQHHLHGHGPDLLLETDIHNLYQHNNTNNTNNNYTNTTATNTDKQIIVIMKITLPPALS